MLELAARVFARLRCLLHIHIVHIVLHPVRNRLNLLKSLILPLITYCDFVYAAALDSITRSAIVRAFNACVRYIVHQVTGYEFFSLERIASGVEAHKFLR